MARAPRKPRCVYRPIGVAVVFPASDCGLSAAAPSLLARGPILEIMPIIAVAGAAAA